MRLPPSREVVLNLVLLGVSCGVALGLAEGAMRLWADRILRSGEFIVIGEVFDADDPLLGYSPIPNATRTIARGGIAINRERINSRGLRDVEHAPRKAPGTKRILVLGDSFMYGDGVDLDETMPRLLSEQMPGVEVVNAGVRGYDLGQEFLYYKDRGHAYEPDLVLLAFFVNDLEPDSQMEAVDGPDGLPLHYRRTAWSLARERERTPRGSSGSISSWLRSRSMLCVLIRDRLDAIRQRRDAAAPSSRGAPGNPPYVAAFRVRSGDGRIPEGWERAYRILDALEKEVSSRRARLVVVTIPAPWQLTQESWDRWVAWLRADPALLSRRMPQEMVTAWCERSGTACLDLLAEFEGGDRSRLYFAHDSHWTPEGHRLAARAVEAFLASSRLP